MAIRLGALRRLAAAVVIAAAAAVSAAAQGKGEDAKLQLERAMGHYGTLVMKMAHDSIAALYARDGVLAAPGRDPIVGPAAIAAFLRTFDNYRVIEYGAETDSVRVRGDTGVTFATWTQRVRVPAGDTVTVGGRLEATWVRVAPGDWRIARMATRP